MFVEDQIRSADVLIINKTDLVNESELNDVVDWISEIAPGSPQYQTRYAEVPFEMLFGTNDDSTSAYTINDNSEGTILSHQENYQSWLYESTEALSWEKVEPLLAEMPESIYRVKGFLHLSQHPDKKCTLQIVNRKIALDCTQTWNEDDPKNQLVFIGSPDINTDRFIESIDDLMKLNGRTARWGNTR